MRASTGGFTSASIKKPESGSAAASAPTSTSIIFGVSIAIDAAAGKQVRWRGGQGVFQHKGRYTDRPRANAWRTRRRGSVLDGFGRFHAELSVGRVLRLTRDDGLPAILFVHRQRQPHA